MEIPSLLLLFWGEWIFYTAHPILINGHCQNTGNGTEFKLLQFDKKIEQCEEREFNIAFVGNISIGQVLLFMITGEWGLTK